MSNLDLFYCNLFSSTFLQILLTNFNDTTAGTIIHEVTGSKEVKLYQEKFVIKFEYSIFLRLAPLIYKARPSYSDGTKSMGGTSRPPAGMLSDKIFSGPDGLPSARNLTALFAFFGKNSKLRMNHLFIYISVHFMFQGNLYLVK